MLESPMTLLERVEIFAVADQTKGDRIKTGDSSKVNARQISLIVAPEQVNWLLLAKRKGQLELLWREPFVRCRLSLRMPNIRPELNRCATWRLEVVREMPSRAEVKAEDEAVCSTVIGYVVQISQFGQVR